MAPQRRSIRAEVGRWRGTTGAVAEGNGGIGGLHTSDDVGERGSARTRPSKGGPCGWELLEGTKSDVLTSGFLSPELQEVAERGAHTPYVLLAEKRNRKPHPRKSRMVEISLSGSGEGPRGAIPRGYSTNDSRMSMRNRHARPR